MNNQNILKAVIERAVENGWDMFGALKCTDFDRWEIDKDCGGPFLVARYKPIGFRPYSVNDVLFNHDFAKAFFGEAISERLDCGHIIPDGESGVHQCDYWDGSGFSSGGWPAWRYHLQQLVLEPKPLRYLKTYLDERS